jgi:hypothetical protein
VCVNNILSTQTAVQFKKRNSFPFIIAAKKGTLIQKNTRTFIYLKDGSGIGKHCCKRGTTLIYNYIVHHIVLLIFKIYHLHKIKDSNS